MNNYCNNTNTNINNSDNEQMLEDNYSLCILL